ncbi:MAG: hypothetical protein AAFY88_14350 [Acidobacteriota bacterium]
MSAEAIYLAGLLVFLALMRSPWPWTRAGGAALAAAAVAGALALGAFDAGWTGVDRPMAAALGVLAAALLCVSLHQAHLKRPAELAPDASRWRWVGLAGALVLVTLAADQLGAPPLPEGAPPPRADGMPWYLAGLAALAPMVGGAYAFAVVPAAALIGLLLAPDLDALGDDVDPPGALDTGLLPAPVAFEGRRDEVPFFLFAWLSVGVAPIVLAAWRPDFGQLELWSLATRFWIDAVGRPAPSAWWLRELPGLLLYLVIFVGLPLRLPTWKASKGVFGRHRRRLGPRRYAAVMAITGALALVPVKVLLAWLFGIGPWIVVGGVGL